MFSKYLFLLTLLLIFDACLLAAELVPEDSLRIYRMKPVIIQSDRIDAHINDFPEGKISLSKALNSYGFELIRKGTFFAQDIYADGLKRADYTVVVDGERYHSACPNRMDSPFTRINSLEMQSITLIKNSSSLQSSLGGAVSILRNEIADEFSTNLTLSKSFINSNDIDAGAVFDYKNHRFMARYATGFPYYDANSKSFKENYNYKDKYPYTLAEMALQGESDDVSYRLSIAYTEDISFPYLKMDERWNYIYSGFFKYQDNKIYFNYTDHLMDNTLRNDKGYMETAAKNLTIGATGSFYDFYYRNWNMDNLITTKTAEEVIRIDNNMIPNIHLFSLVFQKEYEVDKLILFSKLGAEYVTISNNERLAFYQAIYPDAKDNRIFLQGSFGALYNFIFSNELSLRLFAEGAIQPPQPEQLYISVKKPGKNPYWSGNPELNSPKKISFKSSFNFYDVKFEVFYHKIFDFVNISKDISDIQYSSFRNINARFLGLNINYKNNYLDFFAAYTWAENTKNNTPLSEISPLNISTTIKSPEIYKIKSYISFTYNDAQLRVDKELNELPTPSWIRIDLGLQTTFDRFAFVLNAENILNEYYYRHLSYMRDPFASGFYVFEPGTTLRININYKTN